MHYCEFTCWNKSVVWNSQEFHMIPKTCLNPRQDMKSKCGLVMSLRQNSTPYLLWKKIFSNLIDLGEVDREREACLHKKQVALPCAILA